MTNELQTDDEALREAGMTDGPKKIGKWRLEPMNVDTLGWMQSIGVFDDENDISLIHKSAAFVVMHSAPEDELMGVVFNKRDFWIYVSKWLRKNVRPHDELLPYAKELNSAWDRYNACVSSSVNPSEDTPGAKN